MMGRWFFCLCSFFFFIQNLAFSSGFFEWGPSKTEEDLSLDLKKRWAASMLQECIRNKLVEQLDLLGVPFSLEVEEGMLPCRFKGVLMDHSSSNLTEEIKKYSSSDLSEAFEFIRTFWREWILQERGKESHPLWEKESYFSNVMTYSQFVSTSEEILSQLSLDDLMKEMPSVNTFQKNTHSSYWTSSDSQFHQSSAYLPTKKGWEPAGGGKGGSPKSEESKAFFELRLTDEDKVLIRKIVTNMADKNVFQLLLDKKTMERKGDKINPVHPMRFIGFVLADANLRRCMKAVSKSTFKWNGFLEGYEKRMKEEAKANNLNRFVPGLADQLEVDRSVIQHYITHADYEGLVKYFL